MGVKAACNRWDSLLFKYKDSGQKLNRRYFFCGRPQMRRESNRNKNENEDQQRALVYAPNKLPVLYLYYMKRIAMIPARYAATRFPGKLMQMLNDKPVIRHTYDNTLATGLFDEVWVVTDSDIIYEAITAHGGRALMSIRQHESGSDRIAEAAADMHADIIVNVQGDEPFVKKEPLQKLLQVFTGAEGEKVQVASLMQVLKEQRFIEDPNYVKVAVDLHMNALMFSRSVVPYPRSKDLAIIYYEHIGVYAFRKKALLDFTGWPVTPLEAAEKIECLRYLEHGVSLKMVVTDYMGVEIDTPEDLERAAGLLSAKND